jgi:transcriptional regulator with XRE-family HTH domain
MDKNKMSGARIKSARKAKGITQKQFGEAMDIAQARVSLIESGGATLTPKQFLQVAHFLGETVSYFMSEDVKEKPAINTDGFTEGLEELVQDSRLMKAMSIQQQEIDTLASITSEKLLTKESYIQMLYVIRQA